MTLELDLGPELVKKLCARAAAAGKRPEEYALEAVAEKLSVPDTFDEILAAIRAAAEASGLSAEERDLFLEEVLAQARSERKSRG